MYIYVIFMQAANNRELNNVQCEKNLVVSYKTTPLKDTYSRSIFRFGELDMNTPLSSVLSVVENAPLQSLKSLKVLSSVTHEITVRGKDLSFPFDFCILNQDIWT